MKTAKQWAARVQNSKEPWEKLVAEIQSDAAAELRAAAKDAMFVIQEIERTSKLDPLTFSYTTEAHAIKKLKSALANSETVAAMPNNESSASLRSNIVVCFKNESVYCFVNADV
jgi:hypothetical protein